MLQHYPDALLIAAGECRAYRHKYDSCQFYVQGALERGRVDAINLGWSKGIPPANFFLPCLVNRQLPHLIKQADVAVFASHERGTNLMAKRLFAGVPTLISAITGHLDLLTMGFGHALPMGQADWAS